MANMYGREAQQTYESRASLHFETVSIKFIFSYNDSLVAPLKELQSREDQQSKRIKCSQDPTKVYAIA